MFVPRFNKRTKPKNNQQKDEISKGKEIYGVGWCAGINFLLLREAFPNVLENFFTAILFLKQ